jgi:hypothetical protein
LRNGLGQVLEEGRARGKPQERYEPNSTGCWYWCAYVRFNGGEDSCQTAKLLSLLPKRRWSRTSGVRRYTCRCRPYEERARFGTATGTAVPQQYSVCRLLKQATHNTVLHAKQRAKQIQTANYNQYVTCQLAAILRSRSGFRSTTKVDLLD